jgi:hypothetical protein
MAKFIIEYDVRIGDSVRFEDPDGQMIYGVVQDVSQLPDVSVESMADGVYKRYRLGVDKLDFSPAVRYDVCKNAKCYFGDDEPVEFIRVKGSGIMCRKRGETDFEEMTAEEFSNHFMRTTKYNE